MQLMSNFTVEKLNVFSAAEKMIKAFTVNYFYSTLCQGLK